MARTKRGNPEINSSSMADIAFLLLIFFLVTTTIANDMGLIIQLPPKPEDIEDIEVKLKERNLFKVYVNSYDKLLVDGEPMTDARQLRDKVKKHVLNYKKDPSMSDSPKDAVISFKTDRGTSYEMYINVLNELQGAYHEMYGERIGVSAKRWREITSKLKEGDNQRLYDKGRGFDPVNKTMDFPMNISIAEPTKIE